MFDDTGALVRRKYSLSELDPGTAAYDSLRQSMSESFSFATWDNNELIRANMGEEDLRFGPFEAQEPEKLKVLFGVEKKLPTEQAEAQIKAKQLPLKVPENGVTQKALDILVERKQNEIMRKKQIEDSTGFFNGSVQFSAAVAGQMLDPVNLALSFMPVIAPARYSAMVAGANNAWSRSGIRAGVGALEGTAGAVAVEPAIYFAKQEEQADYQMSDSLWNVALGGVLGGGLHVGGGAYSDFRAGRRSQITPQGATAQAVDNASPQTREAMLKTGLQMEAQGYNADVTAVAAMDPALNPAIFVQRNPKLYFDQVKKRREAAGVMSRMKRPEYRQRVSDLAAEAKRITSTKGVSPDVDSIQDAISKLGGIARTAAESEGFDPAGFAKNRAFRKSGGKGFDEMAEALNQYGYRSLDGSPLDANSLVDIMVNGADPERVMSVSGRQGPDTDLIRQLKKSGYKPEDVSKALEKMSAGEPLGARQQRIVEDALTLIGGRRMEERGPLALQRKGGAQSTRTPQQAESEIMDFLSKRAMSEQQVDDIERLLDLMEDNLLTGDEFVSSVKSMFPDLPMHENPGLALQHTVENGFKAENVRGADKAAADEAEMKLAEPERNVDQELEQIQVMFDEHEKARGAEPADLAEYDAAITKAEQDATAFEAAFMCRLNK
ncbi:MULTISPECIES: hypothetical protein [unclassified Vibrio]|uniref:hypothetical protein n=1 Tax=unclassified Vibrio TaxID=2614977 RepID=UPI0013615CB3|nr:MULTISPECIES: hypothetical protein [unclassified Vibrio]NAW60071.1 hypothetical protein [Vibrio sp. V36_P2S2PM302]NAX25972.1 hypothetical protein [Vibrio sp. V38_P2S17PM301]NAX30650.1 hypothetical protein [Vibrio sp. V37_P2S8PM304]